MTVSCLKKSKQFCALAVDNVKVVIRLSSAYESNRAGKRPRVGLAFKAGR